MSEEIIRLLIGLLCFTVGGIVGFFLCDLLAANDPARTTEQEASKTKSVKENAKYGI